MKITIKKKPVKAADFLGTFKPKAKRSRSEPRTRIRRLLKEAISFQDKEVLEEIQKKFPI